MLGNKDALQHFRKYTHFDTFFQTFLDISFRGMGRRLYQIYQRKNEKLNFPPYTNHLLQSNFDIKPLFIANIKIKQLD